ncbi:MAG: conjugal transfer protein TraD [Rhodobiaceae bacterium]|nr:conjugal transfer protein TraD [Rhodobiaceae bacterium]
MERAADTRHKIQLGGLVIKAGLDDLASNELLGALLEIKDILDSPDADQNLRKFMRRGRRVFEEDEKRREEKQQTRGDFE